MKLFSGRGTYYNPENQYEKTKRGKFFEEGIDKADKLPAITRSFIDNSKGILSKNDSPDIPFQYSINPYQGCEHGCIYCYARNSHNYYGFSAGLDFEVNIIAKPNAATLLEKEFMKKNWRPEPIIMSGNTDCYQPAERKLKITRGLLEVFLKYRHPVSIITKNVLILRDIYILKELAALQLLRVAITITTLCEETRLAMEPRTVHGEKKIKAIAKLSAAGIPVSVMMGPIIPGINGHEIEDILKRASDAGALNGSYTMIRLNGAVGELFTQWLQTYYPDRTEKVLSAIRSLHGGNLNDSRWGLRMKGEGALATTFHMLFKAAKKKYFQDCSLPPFNTKAFIKGGQYPLF
ncbi:MAG: PA0069 family radical SAM protein [Cyclobacteriaceae bacterium]|nr:PA0069 family radical SAM protein [Cyclobacteriaceae bacterium]